MDYPNNPVFDRTAHYVALINPDGTPGGPSGGSTAAPGSSSTNTTQDAVVAVPSAAGGIQIVASSTKPRVVGIPNNGTSNIGLFVGPTAGAIANAFVTIFPGGYWESPVPTTSAFAGISASGTNNVTPVEYL